MALKLINTSAPTQTRGPKPKKMVKLAQPVRCELVLECSSTQGLLEGVDKVWMAIQGAVSHRRITKAALVIGVQSLSQIDSGMVRKLVSRRCPVTRKYWDEELGLWL